MTVIDLTTPVPTITQTVTTPTAAAGIAVSADGSWVLVGTNAGAELIDAHAAEQDPVGVHPIAIPGPDAIDVAVTADGATGFALSEKQGTVTVLDLDQARLGHPAATVVATIPVGVSPAGMTLNATGDRLYVVAQYATQADLATPQGPAGRLFALNVAAARTDPTHAVIAMAPAGCTPVRVALDTEGIAWITSRGSNAVLALETTSLAAHPDRSLLAVVPVGSAPVGITAIDGHRLAVANSDRFTASGAQPSIVVINTAAALGRQPAVLVPYVSGQFPRGVMTSGDHRLIIVTDYNDGTIEIIPTTAVPNNPP